MFCLYEAVGSGGGRTAVKAASLSEKLLKSGCHPGETTEKWRQQRERETKAIYPAAERRFQDECSVLGVFHLLTGLFIFGSL